MEIILLVALVSHVVLWNFMELRNKKTKDENDEINTSENTASPGSAEETQPPRDDDAANETSATPPPRAKRKKKDNEGSSKSPPSCRFCKQIFGSPQALGGHMNRHRGEREKEEFQKAKILIHTKGQNFASGYPSGGVGPSYYQPEGNSGNHYQGQMANASMMGNMGAGGLQRQVYQNSNQQQFTGAPQMNPNYGTHQQTAQASNYQSQPQHGGSYVNYNQCDNAPRPPHVPSGVPQTSYTPRANSGQYQAQAQGTGSLRDVRTYAMPQGGSTTRVGPHQSNTGFSGHNLSQAAGGANVPTVDNIATPARSNSNAGLHQSTSNQAVAQFVDQCGNIVIKGPSSGYSTLGLRPLNPSHFHDNVQATSEYDQGPPQDHYTSQASYAGTSVHAGTIQVQSDQYDATVGMENQYHVLGVGLLNFEDPQEGDEFGNGGPDLSTIEVTESGHGGGGGSTGRSADARSHP